MIELSPEWKLSSEELPGFGEIVLTCDSVGNIKALFRQEDWGENGWCKYSIRGGQINIKAIKQPKYWKQINCARFSVDTKRTRG